MLGANYIGEAYLAEVYDVGPAGTAAATPPAFGRGGRAAPPVTSTSQLAEPLATGPLADTRVDAMLQSALQSLAAGRAARSALFERSPGGIANPFITRPYPITTRPNPEVFSAL